MVLAGCSSIQKEFKKFPDKPTTFLSERYMGRVSEIVPICDDLNSQKETVAHTREIAEDEMEIRRTENFYYDCQTMSSLGRDRNRRIAATSNISCSTSDLEIPEGDVSLDVVRSIIEQCGEDIIKFWRSRGKLLVRRDFRGRKILDDKQKASPNDVYESIMDSSTYITYVAEEGGNYLMERELETSCPSGSDEPTLVASTTKNSVLVIVCEDGYELPNSVRGGLIADLRKDRVSRAKVSPYKDDPILSDDDPIFSEPYHTIKGRELDLSFEVHDFKDRSHAIVRNTLEVAGCRVSSETSDKNEQGILEETRMEFECGSGN